jgi:hypothetical protein
MSTRTALRCTLAFFTALLLSVSANAQLFRAYLASDGNDTNACTLAAPCRLLPAALSAVASGGEIRMLDSANYNNSTTPVVITKSVSILAVPGAVGSVLAIGGPAISITAGSLNVELRNLVIVPLTEGGATHGILMTGASTRTIEDSLIANQPGYAGDDTVDLALGPARLLVRRPQFAIEVDAIGAGEFALLEQIACGGTLAQACLQAVAAEPGFDLGGILRKHVEMATLVEFDVADA